MYKIILVVITTFFSLSSFSQTLITGKIVDAKSRQPLEAAVIQQAGKNNIKSLSDSYGDFSIEVDNNNSPLIVSYIGYKPDSINLAGKTDLLISLKSDAVSLKDIVLTQNSGQQKFAALARVDLDLKPVRNTQELMRLVPGLFIAQHAGGGKAEQIFLRGFDCDHGTDIAVSVDGLPVNMVSHAHGQGYADAHFIIPETVNNIDYGTGPYYAQIGNLNTAGYVNFSTYNNIAKSRVQIEGGLFNTYRALAMIDLLKKNKDKQSAYFAGEYNYTNGPTVDPQKFSKVNLFAKYNLAISPNNQLTASVSAFTSKWNASGQIPERAVEKGLITRFGSIDPTEGGNTQRYNANIILNSKLSNGSSWMNQAYYTRNIFSLYSNFTFFLLDPVNGDEIHQAESRNMVGYLSKLSHTYYFKNWSLKSIYGAGFRYDATDSTLLAHSQKRQLLNYINLGNIKELNAFGYVEEQINVGKWSIDAGLRFDYLHFYYQDLLHDQLPAQGKSIVSPKLNVQYTINPKVQLYVKGGKGFHSNDSRVVVGNGGYNILPSALGTDLGMVLKPSDKLLLNVAVWYLHLQQEFVYNGDDAALLPGGATVRKGVDIIARYQFSKNLFANIDINLTNPKTLNEAKGQDYIGLAPTATSTGGIFYKRKSGINGSVSYRYIADRSANEDNSIVARGYCILDGAINYSKDKFEIGLAFENLLNSEWNEAQFATESRLRNEPEAVNQLNYTPGIPFFARLKLAVFF